MVLVDLSCQIKRALAENFGELDEQTEKMLSTLETNLPQKADGYKFVVDDLENEAALWKSRANQFQNVAKAFEKYADNMKARILNACAQMEVTEIEGENYRWKLQKAKPSVIIEDETKIPSGHKEVVQTIKIRKDSILEDLKSGIPVSGAKLEESLYVRCYVNTKGKKK